MVVVVVVVEGLSEEILLFVNTVALVINSVNGEKINIPDSVDDATPQCLQDTLHHTFR